MIEFDYASIDNELSFVAGHPDEGLYADVVITPGEKPDYLIAQCYVEAPSRGDEVVALVDERLQELADTTGQTVIHIATPENKGSKRLFARTEGYAITGEKDFHGNPIYEKVFAPKTVLLR